MNCTSHPERDAASYCKACEKFLCDQCKATHSAVYEGEHELSPVDPVVPANAPETNCCHEHPDNELDMFCNDCHELCCYMCELKGKHKDHCLSKVAGSEKNFMAILETCMSEFDHYLGGFNNAYNSLYDEVSVCRSQAKCVGEAIKNAFGKLRKAIDAREAELLGEVEREVARYNTEAKVLSEAKGVSESKPIEKARAVLDNWKKTDAITSIKAVLSAEADVKKLKEFKALLGAHKEETIFVFDNEDVDEKVSAVIASYGKFFAMRKKRRPHNFTVHHVGALAAVVSWDKSSTFEKYCVLRKKKSEKDFEKEPVWEGVKNTCVLYRVSPNSEYDFCVKGLCGNAWSAESNVVHVKTADLTIKELADLKKKPDSRSTCVKVFRYIIGHTTDESREVTAKNDGAIELVIKCIESHIENPDLCKLGCETLKAISLRTGDKEGIAGVSGAIDLVVKIMCMYLSNEEVCNACFEALGVMIKENVNSQAIAGKAGACDALINMMNSHIGNSSLCEQGCRSLQIITADPNNQKYIGNSIVIEKIMTILNKHIENPSICENSCATLKNILINPEILTIANKSKVVETILNVLKKYTNNTDVCHKCLDALKVMADGSSESRKILNSKEAYSIIVPVINKNIKSAEICQAGCRTIWNITERATSQSIAKESGIIETSVNAMRNHIDDEDICESCCSTLWKITNDLDNQVIAKEVGAVDITVGVMGKYIKNANICEKGSQVIRNIATSVRNKEIAGKAGAIGVLVNVIRQYMDNADMCENCLAALWSVTFAENQTFAGKAGAVDCVLMTINKHIDNPVICKSGCGVLCGIIENNIDNQARAGNIEPIKIIMKVLKTHKTNQSVTFQAVWTLKSLDPSVGDTIRELMTGDPELSQFINQVF